jgi:hypothetical protein
MQGPSAAAHARAKVRGALRPSEGLAVLQQEHQKEGYKRECSLMPTAHSCVSHVTILVVHGLHRLPVVS